MKETIKIETDDGSPNAAVFRPDNGSRARHGIIFYMDALGPRQSLFDMGQRLADAGYVVLLPDLLYRFGDYGPFSGATFRDPVVREAISAMVRATTQEATRRDSAAFLDALNVMDIVGPVGVVGYCMGGARALTAAAAYPTRVAAAAIFHGGHLASDAADSPHRLCADIKARVYVGTAGVDSSFPSEQSARLAEALRLGQVDHVIENYVGMSHGWTVPDLDVYDEKGAERHWKRLLNLFEEALNPF